LARCFINNIDDVEKSSTVIEEAVLYLTKKVDSKTRDVKVLQPTIATQTVTPVI
jgi:protein KTI12